MHQFYLCLYSQRRAEYLANCTLNKFSLTEQMNERDQTLLFFAQHLIQSLAYSMCSIAVYWISFISKHIKKGK